MTAVKRKLAALIAADVAEYSRHVREDEEGAIAALHGHREIVDRLIIQHDGHIANTAGDSVLAEFNSPVEAVRCAIEIQEAVRGRNGNLLEPRRMWFRVGINLGDVIVQDNGDLLGDGVNIAARLQSLADPGGICISHSVREQVENKVALGFEDLGDQRVKNIPQPVHAYKLRSGPGVVKPPIRVGSARRVAVASGVLVALALGGAGWYVAPSIMGDHRYDGLWSGDYTCEAGPNPSFTVHRLAAVRNGNLAIARGQATQPGYVDIKGTVSRDGAITASGRGIGPLGPYTAELTGKIFGDTMNLSGFHNGARRCTATLKREPG